MAVRQSSFIRQLLLLTTLDKDEKRSSDEDPRSGRTLIGYGSILGPLGYHEPFYRGLENGPHRLNQLSGMGFIS